MALSEDDVRRIGGSDVAPILGLSEHAGAIDVWRRIVLGERTEENAAMRRGILMEPVIREMVRAEYGLRLLGPRRLRDPKRPYVRCSLDDASDEADTEVPVEYKSVSARAAYKLGDGEDDVPQSWLCQVQFYLAETGAPRARLFALVGVDDLREYVIKADAELQGILFEQVDRFYTDFVKTKTPPPPDASAGYSEYLTARYPSSGAALVRATPEAEAWVQTLRAAEQEMAKQKALADAAKNALKAAIGEAKGLEGDGWRVNWGTVKGRETTDWKSVCAEAHVPAELVAKHTQRRAGYRAWRASWKKENGDE